MQRPLARACLLLAAVLTLSALVPVPASAQATTRTATMAVRPEAVRFDTGAVYDHLRLTVDGPDHRIVVRRADGAAGLSLGLTDDAGQALPDGLYSYELRGTATDGEPGGLIRSGFFTIRDGSFVSPEIQETPGGPAQNQPGGTAQVAEKDQVVLDDLIVDGSLCAGFDCANGEAFGFSTMILKENNTRIKFDDTSSSGSFPNQDWFLIANDSLNGGANRFSISDGTRSDAQLTILAGAPANALFVDAQGDVGAGTSTPSTKLHLVDGDTPTLRLAQDDSSGFAPQTWDVAGNEVGFFVRDVTNGSLLPLRIRAGAPSSSIDVASNGNVGIGTDAPAARLDVAGDLAVAGTVDGRDVAADGAALDAHVTDFANPHQVTAAQAGADPAGAATTAVAAHEATFDHTNIPSALPVPIAEGGTGATDAATARANLGIEENLAKTGIVAAAAFSGNPATATVTFAEPFAAGTTYAVLLTAVTDDAKKVETPNLVAKDETGFTVTLGAKGQNLVELDWLARPVGE